MGYLKGKAFWKTQLQLDVNANVAVIDQENNAVAIAEGGDVEVKDSFIAIGSFRQGGGPLETGPGDLVILSGGDAEAEVEQSNEAEVNQTILDVEVNDCCEPCRLESDHCAVA
jgi:hypothetical protein